MNFLALPLFAGCGSPLASFTQYDNKKRAEHMSNARMAKARAGAVVSSLPVGWIKGPDGKYDFDPEVKDAIPAIIDTFRQQRSIRRTIKALAEAGTKVPCRQGKRLYFVRPSLNNIRNLNQPLIARNTKPRALPIPAVLGAWCFCPMPCSSTRFAWSC